MTELIDKAPAAPRKTAPRKTAASKTAPRKAAPRAASTTTAKATPRKAPAKASAAASGTAPKPRSVPRPRVSAEPVQVLCVLCDAPMTDAVQLKLHLSEAHGAAPEITPPAAPQPVFQELQPSVPPAASLRTRYKVIGGIVVGIVALGIIGVVAGGSDSKKGFNDPDRLAADIMVEVNAKMADEGSSVQLTDVTCIPAGTAHVFTCHGTYSDGDQDTVHATVSASGDTWITDSG